MARRTGIAIAFALALVAIPIAGVQAASRPPSAIPDVTILFGRAVRVVRATAPPRYSRAVVLEADGITRGGQCTPMGCSGGRGTTSASGIVSWRFVFNNQLSSQKIRSATIFYGPAPKRFGKVTGFAAPFLEDNNIPKAPRMTLRQAVTLLQRTGHRGTFFNVTLRSPLGPGSSHVLYIFGFANTFVAVDTVTKKVRAF